MWQQQGKLQQLNLRVIAITFEPQETKASPPAGGTPYVPLLLDRDRKLYHYYGMYSARFWDLWGPKTVAAYLRIIFKGKRPQRSQGDIYQRGGDVLVDPQGMIRLHHIGSGPGDRPALDSIFDMVSSGEERIRAGGWLQG